MEDGGRTTETAAGRVQTRGVETKSVCVGGQLGHNVRDDIIDTGHHWQGMVRRPWVSCAAALGAALPKNKR